MHTVLLYDEGAQGSTQLGGGQLSRLSLMERLSSEFYPVLLTSRNGKLADEARTRGIDVQVEGILGSFNRFTRRELQTKPYIALSSGANLIKAVTRLRQIVQEINPDIVHPNENLARLLTSVALFDNSTPRVMHIDGEWNSSYVDALMRRLYVHSFDRLIAVSEAVGDAFGKNGRPDNVKTIYPGIELDRFDDVEEPNTPFPDSEDRLVLTTVGSLIPVKGHETLIRALSKVDEDFVLFVVGSGPLESKFKSLVRSLGISDTVRFLGFRDDVPEIYGRTDIAITPSLSEAFPRVVLEAMASSVPVIASNVGGISEAMVDGQTGLLVPPTDSDALASAISKLASDSDRRRQMGLAGRERVREKFAFEHGVTQVESLYRELIESQS